MTSRRALVTLVLLLLTVSGLGAYVWKMARKARQAAATVSDLRPVAPPVTGAPAPATLFLANDAEGTLRKQEIAIPLPADPDKRAREILRALVAKYQERGSAHPLGATADVNEVYVIDNSLAVVDVNSAFAQSHSSGILVEELTLASLAETLAANLPAITRMKLLVDGQERPTLAGHAGLAEPYAVAAGAAMVK
jgi:hypothetical protein